MSAQLRVPKRRLVLVGKTGAGKSATGNTILGRDHFHKAASSKSVTKECSLASATINGKNVTVVDTPGWCDTELSPAELTEETVKCIDMTYPGPHAFLLILTIGRFTDEEKQTIQKIQEIFGEEATRYTMILFTRGDDLEDKSIEDYLKEASPALKTLIDKCNGRYHVFNNRTKNLQVFTLLKKIEKMVEENGGECYTNTTYQLLEKYKKREAELKQEAETARKKMEAREAELHRLITNMVEQNKNILSVMEQMKIQNDQRKQEEENRQNLFRAQAEHQRRTDKKQHKQREQQLKHEHYMEEEKMRRQHEEAQHRSRIELEMQRFEREKLEMLRNYEKIVYKLEQEKRATEAEKKKSLDEQMKQKKSNCVIS